MSSQSLREAIEGTTTAARLDALDQALQTFEWGWIDNPTVKIPIDAIASAVSPLATITDFVAEFLTVVKGILEVIESLLVGIVDTVALLITAVLDAVRSLLNSLTEVLTAHVKVLYVPIIPASRYLVTANSSSEHDAKQRKLFENWRASLNVSYSNYHRQQDGRIYLSEDIPPSSLGALSDAAGGLFETPPLDDSDLWNFGTTLSWERWWSDFKEIENLDVNFWNAAIESRTKGGLAKFQSIVLSSLEDPGDSARPQFGSIGAVAGFCLVWGAPDLAKFIEIYESLKDLGWPPSNVDEGRFAPQPRNLRAYKIPGNVPRTAWARIEWEWPTDVLDMNTFADPQTRYQYQIHHVQVFRYRGPYSLQRNAKAMRLYAGGVGDVPSDLLNTAQGEELKLIYQKEFDPPVSSSWSAFKSTRETFYVDEDAPFDTDEDNPFERGYRIEYGVRFYYLRSFLRVSENTVLDPGSHFSPVVGPATLYPGHDAVRKVSVGTPPDWLDIAFGEFAVPWVMEQLRGVYAFLDALEEIVNATSTQLKKLIEDTVAMANKWIDWAFKINSLVRLVLEVVSTLGQLGANGFYFYGLQGNDTIRQAAIHGCRVPPKDPTDPAQLVRMTWDDPRLDPDYFDYDSSLASVSRDDLARLQGQPRLYDDTLVGGLMLVAGSDALEAFTTLIATIFGFSFPAGLPENLLSQLQILENQWNNIEDVAVRAGQVLENLVHGNEDKASSITFTSSMEEQRDYPSQTLPTVRRDDPDADRFSEVPAGPQAPRNRALDSSLEVVDPRESGCGS